jgi:hypothetical protein
MVTVEEGLEVQEANGVEVVWMASMLQVTAPAAVKVESDPLAAEAAEAAVEDTAAMAAMEVWVVMPEDQEE